MAKELEHIAGVTNVGDLPQKMEDAEEAKKDVESSILERVISIPILNRFLQFLFTFTERPVTRNLRRVGTMREEDQRRSRLD